MKNFQILDIDWKSDNTNKPASKKSYFSQIKIYDLLNKEIKSFELSSFNFKFKLSEKRYCTGYYQDGSFHLCKLANDSGLGLELDNNTFVQCRVCEKIQGFKAAFLFKGEANENMQKFLAQKHFIYLAYFEPGIIKVGTAAESRKYIRPVEQDALIYAYIAQSDGFNIQKLERFISKNIGITEAVSSKHKFKYLSQIPNFQLAENLIKSNFQKIADLLQNNEEFGNWLFDSVEVNDLTLNPAFYYPKEKVNLINSYEYLSGQYLGFRARYLLLDNYGKIVAFDIKPIIGRTFEYIESYEYKIEGEEQLGFTF